MKGRIKVLIALALIILAMVFVLENLEQISITLFGMGLKNVPLALVVLVLLGTGFLIGWLTGTWRSRGKGKK